jgi:hypothetical protein
MTDHTRALLEQALKALEYHTQQTRPIQKTEHAILAIRAELAKPSAPAWHDAPTCAGWWVRNSHEGIDVYSISEPSINILKGSASRWYGPICEDAAIAKAEGRKE